MNRFQHEDHKWGRQANQGDSGEKALVGFTDLSEAQKFARETIQNSTDANDESSDPVHISFRIRELDSREEDVWEQCLGIKSYIIPRISSVVDGVSDSEYSGLGSILYIEDYATLGLTEIFDESCGGHKADSRFVKFFFGSGDNNQNIATGGSFGYGKAMYTTPSIIQTMVAYSCTIENGSIRKKLFGITRTPAYNFEGERYMGNIYHGVNNGPDSELSQPILDDQADELAAKLGFNLRGDTEQGTSIAVLGLRIEPVGFIKDIKLATSIFWWKKIVDNELSVDFSINNDDLGVADPSDVSLLLPFVEAYEIATGRKERPNDLAFKFDSKKLRNSQRLGYPPGSLVLLEVKPSEDSDIDTSNFLVNSVAMIRSAGMVVEYLKPDGSRDSGVYCSGVFVADDRLNKLLRSSEPADHWGWNSTSPRIRKLKAYEDIQISLEAAQGEIKSIRTRIITKFQSFSQSLQPTKPVSTSSFKTLDQLLTKLLGKGRKKGGGGSPGSAPRMVSIQKPPDGGVEKIVTPDGLTQFKCIVLIRAS